MVKKITDERSPTPEHFDRIMENWEEPHVYVLGPLPGVPASADQIKGIHVTQELDHGRRTKSIARAVKKAVESEGDLFRTHMVGWRGQRYPGVRLGRDATSFLRAIGELDGVMAHFSLHAFNPFLELLRAEQKDVDCLAEVGLPVAGLLMGQDAELFVVRANRLVERLRGRAQSRSFVADLQNLRRQCEKNTEGALEYVDSIFELRGSRHLVCRVDFGYRAPQDPILGPNTVSTSLEDAKECFKKLTRYLREDFPLTGYIWKLEYGLDSGYHFHTILFFAGHQVVKDIKVAEAVGLEWEGKITGGLGRYYNCNRASYWSRGVGMIEHDDHKKLAVLKNKIIPYLTKTDFWLRFEGGGRTFGKGQMPSGPVVKRRPRRGSTEA